MRGTAKAALFKDVSDPCPPQSQGGQTMEKSWKCTACGYTLKDKEPPEECPACKEKCTFVDNIDYTQNIGDKRSDERI